MFNKRKNKKTASPSGMQEYVNIAEIRNDVVILKDGSLRAVLAISSINFDLKSSTEQEAIIYSFQRFLNALDFPIQILVSTRKLNVRPYLNELNRRQEIERNPLLRDQIGDYVDFVGELVKVANITSKSFYVVVPFYPIEDKDRSWIEKITAAINPNKAAFQRREIFQTNRNQLLQRVEEVRDPISATGVRTAMLKTQELVELYYNFYNPSEFNRINLDSIDELKLERY